MRISDWSSDVCSSDLQAFGRGAAVGADQPARAELDAAEPARDHDHDPVHALAVDGREDRAPGGAGRLAVVVGAIVVADPPGPAVELGRASWRERVCQSV